MKKKILFVSYGGGHIKILLPIVKCCKKNNIPYELMALTTAKSNTLAEGIPSKGYKEFSNINDKEKIIKYGKDILLENYNPNSNLDEEESIYYLGINWLENVNRYGENTTKRLYKKVKRHSFLPIKFFEELISKNNFELIVTTNSPKSERAALIAANNLGVKSVRIEDLFFDDNLQMELIKKMEDDYMTSIGKFRASPTKIFVMCEFTKELYKEKKEIMLLDSPESDILVTGQPILDRFSEKFNNNLKNTTSKESKYKYVLWCHQNETIDENEVYLIIRNWLKEYSSKELKLGIRLHPGYENEKYKIEELFVNLNDNYFFIDPNSSIEESIKSCKVLIAQESTTMLEAFFLRKRSISIDPKKVRSKIPYVVNGICKSIQNHNELDTLIKSENDLDELEFEYIKKKMGFKLNAKDEIFNAIKKLFN